MSYSASISQTRSTENAHHHISAPRPPSSAPNHLAERIKRAYLIVIQDFSYYLFKKGWKITSMIFPTIFGEPVVNFRCSIRRIVGWKAQWDKLNFYNALEPKSLDKLRTRLKTDDPVNNKPPLILFCGLFSTPDMWLPWSKQLHQAQKKGLIGHVITLQLSNHLPARMTEVYHVVEAITTIFKEQGKTEKTDLMGHSLGGYAAHLALTKKEYIHIHDEKHIERRWHSIAPEHRNPLVRKVISVAAPTWLCCANQKDETTQCKEHKQDIYPWKIFKNKTVAASYTENQVNDIQANHEGIYDFVASLDAISPNASPLPVKQVRIFNETHCSILSNQKVCAAAIEILSE